MNKAAVIDGLLNKFINQYGYIPTKSDLISLYKQGELTLTNKEENIILEVMHNE